MSLFTLHTLWNHDLLASAPHTVFQATVVACMMLPAWWGLTEINLMFYSDAPQNLDYGQSQHQRSQKSVQRLMTSYSRKSHPTPNIFSVCFNRHWNHIVVDQVWRVKCDHFKLSQFKSIDTEVTGKHGHNSIVDTAFDSTWMYHQYRYRYNKSIVKSIDDDINIQY